MNKEADDQHTDRSGKNSSRRIFIRKLVLYTGGAVITMTLPAVTEGGNVNAARKIREEMDIPESMQQLSPEAVKILRQLQDFDPEVIKNELSRLPKDVVEFKTTETKTDGEIYLTETIIIKDSKALQDLSIRGESVELLKSSTAMFFDPKVLQETVTLVPEGMIVMPSSGRAMSNNYGISFNFDKSQKIGSNTWTPVTPIK